MIPLFHPAIFKEETLEALGTLLDGKQIAQGPVCEKFEKEFGRKFGYKYCLSTNSGSAALELAYELLNLKPGDEVIGPVLTCVATYLPLLRKGVKVVLSDIDIYNLNIFPSLMKEKITEKTKAIIAVDLGGTQASDIVFRIAKEYNLPVVVDASQYLGEKEPRGDFVCYSFQAIKHFTTGDGGMLVCRNKEDYERAKKLRWFGIDREKRVKSGYRVITLNADEPGFKFHMNDIAATMGLIGLKHSDKLLRMRSIASEIYQGIRLDHINWGTNWSCCVFTLEREKFIEKLKEKGIETNLIHTRLDTWSLFGGKRLLLYGMNSVENQYLYIPIHQNVTEDQAKYIVETINGIIV